MDDTATRTLWCGNLSGQVADEVLFDLFLQAGPLEKVSIPKERDGRTKGYAFITFKHECSVPYAMELMKGSTLYGKTIDLQLRTGARLDTSPNDLMTSYQQRSMCRQEQGSLFRGSIPSIDPAQSLNNLYNLAAQFFGSYQPLSQMTQDQTRHSNNPNYQRNRNYNMGGRYHDGNNQEQRRSHYGNHNDRHQTRDNDYRGRARDNDYHDGNNQVQRRGRYGNHSDRHQSRDNDNRGRGRDNDYHDGFRGSNFQGRDRDQSRSNKRPNHVRYRSRE